MAKSHESFEELYEQHQALISDAPVDRDALYASLTKLETVGMASFGRDPENNHAFAEVMHLAYSQPATLEIEPPLSDVNRALFVGKVATYALLMEATVPQPPRKAATDPKAIDTDKPKK